MKPIKQLSPEKLAAVVGGQHTDPMPGPTPSIKDILKPQWPNPRNPLPDNWI